ncbi:MAG: DUF5615 family PIN-like protein [Phycisphaerae bacterium]
MDVRFHLDESVDHAVAEGLRRRGIDVTTATDGGLLGAADESHLEFARSQRRVVFTHDVDFLRLHQRGAPHAGIAYCHQGRHALGGMVLTLAALRRRSSADEMIGRVEFL